MSEAQIADASSADDTARLRRWRLYWFGAVGVIALAIAGALAVGLVFDPSPGHHRNVTGFFLVTAIVVVGFGVISVVGWRSFSRDSSWQHLLRYSWRSRRRALIDLRKGRPITSETRDVAQAIIDFNQRRRFVAIYVLVGALWIFNTIFAHGNQRWFDLVLALAYLGLIPLWLRARRQILSRTPDVLAAGPSAGPA